MTTLSQFFPSGSGGGGGTPGIPLEMLLVSGGGGKGSGSDGPPYSWAGGGGAIEYVNSYPVQPGTTLTVTVGQGGACGTPGSPGTPGSNGGSSSVLDPTGQRFHVLGGGGGGRCVGSCPGLPGGTGGGGGMGPSYGGSCGLGGEGAYYVGTPSSIMCITKNVICRCTFGSPCNQVSYDMACQDFLKTQYGFKGGFPGSTFVNPGGPTFSGGSGGAGGQIGGMYIPPACPSPGTLAFCYPIYNGFVSSIEGTEKVYGLGGVAAGNLCFVCYSSALCRDTCCPNQGWGHGGAYFLCYTSGQDGVVIIKYPDAFAAASPTAYPGATDISPSTPGYRTYRFTSTGTLTLP
jgi:hypothetical protein